MKSGKKMKVESGDNMVIVCKKKATINASDQLTVHVGKAKIILKKNGDISIDGKKINIKGSGPIKIKGSKVDIN